MQATRPQCDFDPALPRSVLCLLGIDQGENSTQVDTLAFDRATGQYTARLHKSPELREPRVACQSFLISKIDLLYDHGDLQQSIHKIENGIVNPSPSSLHVVLEQLSPRKAPGQTR